MAITPAALRLIAPYLRGTVLSFGYPDLLMTCAEAGEILGTVLHRATNHGVAHKRNVALAETEEAFSSVGAHLTCIDLIQTRQVEQFCDLNEPQDFAQVDLVIDAGTIEHCANIGQALMNGANAVKVGGHIFHSPPMSMVNHGFYNLCPTLLMDFYEQNGWQVKHISAFYVRGANFHPVVDFSERKRFELKDATALYFLAERLTNEKLRWPVQSKYLKGGLQ